MFKQPAKPLHTICKRLQTMYDRIKKFPFCVMRSLLKLKMHVPNFRLTGAIFIREDFKSDFPG